MVTEVAALNDVRTMRLWSKKLYHEVLEKTKIAPLIGKSEDSIIQLHSVNRKAGDDVTFSLRKNSFGCFMSWIRPLQNFDDNLAIDEIHQEVRDEVRAKNEDNIERKRVIDDFRNMAAEYLVDWYADRLSVMFFIQVCGYTAKTIKLDGHIFPLKPTHYGFNAPIAPSSKCIVRPNGKTKDEELVNNGEDDFTLGMIDKAVEAAALSNLRIKPINIDDENVYVMYLHPIQVAQLRKNKEVSKLKAADTGSRFQNPIFAGSLGMYNGVVLRESEHVTNGVHSITGAPVTSVYRAVLLGKQSAMMAFGRKEDGAHYTLEEEYNECEFVMRSRTVIGMKKTRFHMPDSAQEAQDFGSIVVSTYGGEI